MNESFSGDSSDGDNSGGSSDGDSSGGSLDGDLLVDEDDEFEA